MNERARGALLGLAVGDALGTTYEFEAIEQAPYPELATGPATDVVGGGPFGLAPGAITDDTQMSVCLARSLAEHGRIDVDDVARRYVAWSAGAFDIGNQTRDAIGRIRTGTAAAVAGLATWQQSGRRAAGNGSLMRTAPIAVAIASRRPHHARGGEPDPFSPEVRREAAVIDAAIADSMITHADPRCVLACAVFDAAIAAAVVAPLDAAAASVAGAVVAPPNVAADAASVAGAVVAPPNVAADAASDADRIDGAAMLAAARRALGIAAVRLAERWRAIADRDVDPRTATAPGLSIGREDLAAIDSAHDDLARDLDAAAAADPGLYTPELHVHRTAGFVRVAFRLAFWHCVHTASWRDALVDVASRGGDADTNAAIVGALLGARDGASAIPAAWAERVLAAKQKGSTTWAEAHHPKHLLALAE